MVYEMKMCMQISSCKTFVTQLNRVGFNIVVSEYGGSIVIKIDI